LADNPYQAPNDDADFGEAFTDTSPTLPLVVWWLSFAVHATSFRLGIFFGQYPYGYALSYTYASVLFAILAAESYRRIVSKVDCAWHPSPLCLSTWTAMMLIVTFNLTVVVVQNSM
jgi:hypothetical protein